MIRSLQHALIGGIMLRKIVLGTVLLALLGLTAGCDDEIATTTPQPTGTEATEEEGGEATEEEGGEATEEEGGEATEEEGGEATEEEGGEATEEEGGEATEEEGGEATEEEGGEVTEEEGGEVTEEEGDETTEDMSCDFACGGIACNYKCMDNMIYTCQSDTWEFVEDCSPEGLTCELVLPEGNEQDGEYMCTAGEEEGGEATEEEGGEATEEEGGEATEEGGEATEEEGGEATEEEGGEATEEGACFPEGEAFLCNPFDSSTCDESMDEACDASLVSTEDGWVADGFDCFPSPNTQKPGQPCGEDAGAYCANGLTCGTELLCLVICCSADECEEGQVCEAPDTWGIVAGTTLGVCTWPIPQGMTNTDCGSLEQGEDVVPTDCTANGDTESMCVFSNHCMCSVGFECEEVFEGLMPGAKECAPGSSCVPEFVPQEGTTGTSCGQSNQMLIPVDCTAQGDAGAYCIFGNHCKCTEGFVCGDPDTGEISDTPGGCVSGEICIPE
jgi:hypothetical protein